MGRVTETAMVNEMVHVDLDLIRSFVDDCRLRGYSPETIRSHRSNIRTAARFLKKRAIGFTDLDKEGLRQLLDYLKNDRKVSTKTLDMYFTALSSFYEYLVFEEIIENNPIPSFRKRYLTKYKNYKPGAQRKLLSVEDMSRLINGTLEIRDRALMAVLAKTGVRRGELISMDVDDIDWENGRVKLKGKNKRSNLYVYFDDETAILLGRWLRVREGYAAPGERALFVGDKGKRIGRNMVYRVVTGHAERLGLHDPSSPRLEDHFSPHCFRHWFTTHLRRNGLSREFIKELRGDSRGEAIDIYDHIDHDELRKAYLAAIPRLGVT